MRSLRTNLSCLAVLAGIAAVSIAASGGSAFAAKACAGGPVCVMKADGPQTYDSACAAKAAGAKITHLGACTIFCQGFGATLIAAAAVRDGSAQSRQDDLPEQLCGRERSRDLDPRRSV